MSEGTNGTSAEVAAIRLQLESDLLETQKEISTLKSVLTSKEKRAADLRKLLGKNALQNWKNGFQVQTFFYSKVK